MAVKRCQTCQGNGTVQQEGPPGKWRTVTCPACGGSGKVETKTI